MADRITGLRQCWILNLDTNDRLFFQHMPEQVAESKSANWSDVEILGRSEPIKGYASTGPRTVSLALQFSASFLQGDNGSRRLLEQKLRFCRSLVYPTYTEITLPPPRVLVSIGGWFKMVAVTRDYNITRNGPWDVSDVFPTTAQVSLSFEEANNTPYQSAEILLGQDTFGGTFADFIDFVSVQGNRENLVGNVT